MKQRAVCGCSEDDPRDAADVERGGASSSWTASQTPRRDFDCRHSAARVAFQIWQPELPLRQVALAYQRIMRGDKSSIGRSAASLNRNKEQAGREER